MTTKTVEVKLKARPEGFEQATAKVKKLTDATQPAKDNTTAWSASEKAAKRAAHATAGLGREMKALTAGMKEVVKLFADMGTSKSLADAVQQTRALVRETDKLTEAKKRGKDADDGGGGGSDGGRSKRKRRDDNRHGFGMGLMQGLGVGEYFPRHGLGANVAGRMVGGMARWGAGVAALPLTGMEGFMGAVGALPGVGGFLSGQLQTGFGYAQQHLDYQRQLMGMNPYLSLRTDALAQQAGAAAAGRVPLRRADPKAVAAASAAARNAELAASRANAGKTGEQLQAVAWMEMGKNPADFTPHAPGKWPNMATAVAESRVSRRWAASNEDRAQRNAAEAAAMAGSAEQARQAAAAQASVAARARAAQKAAGDVYRGPWDWVRGESKQYGLKPQEALQAAGQFFGSSGLTADAIMPGGASRGLFSLGLAGQSRLGIGMETAGAFGRAEQTGAIKSGTSTQAYMDAVTQGVRLGLQGSDLNTYMQQTAQAMLQFEQTGMPLDMSASRGIQSQLAPYVGGVRATNLASSLVGAAQNTAQSGPQSAAQFLMLQEMGGYKGGGIDKYFDAQAALERGGLPGGLQGLMKRVQIMGSNKGNALAVQDLLKQLGTTVGVQEALGMVQGGPGAFAGQQAAGAAAASGLTQDSVLAGARRATPGSLVTAAGIAGDQLGVGANLLKSFQDLERTSLNMNVNFGKFGDQIALLTGKLAEMSKGVGPVADAIKVFVDKQLGR